MMPNTWTFFCVIKHEELAPLTATAVFPPPVAAFMAYSDDEKKELIHISLIAAVS